ncbi:Na+/H+ antiporter NhaC family protein [Cetobacterium somerae]|uniref:Na+/H+ antiporter NhaC family protein n=1 Tax=Cetobacterium TaxID=180162 RepID=UPI0022592A67|nr:Na+/H+ antiporter NhaC family protein [Cetobacterium somerae]MCX3066024.1 Na+/H+ antiporter NhaC family protein [Cetobacterium somerae]
MKRIVELLKLSPVLVLAMLMFIGYDALIAAPLATAYAALIASVVEKKKVNDIIDAVIDNAKEMQVAFFILMVAYAMAEVFMSTGVGASIINLALNVGLTGRTVAVVGIIITSILSIATGTSWGTFAACAPIFLWLNHIVGGNIALTIGAIAGGSCFGDNIGLISDTTIVSSGIQKVEVIKRIRHQGYWSGLVLILGIISFYLAGIIMDLPTTTGDAATAIGKIPAEVWTVLAEKRESAVTLLNQVKTGVPVYMIVPLILVLIAAFKGMTTLLCLFIGIFAAYILGMIAGTVQSTGEFLNLLYSGFEGAGSWVIVMMMWIAAFGGIMKLMDAFRPLSNIVISISKNVRQLMFYNGVLSILGNAALADEMAQIVTMGPIIKEIVENNVDGSPEDIETLRLRNATLSDALGVFGSQLIPWHVYIGFYLGIIQAVYPIYKFNAMDIIKYNFLALIAVSTILIATLTGLDRFIPRFGLPMEPKVKLKKYTAESSIIKNKVS